MIALIISLCSGAIVYAVSVMYAGIGETFSERAGIMNLGVEGVMLMGAVSGYITAVHTQNLFLSFLVVLLTGAALGLAFAFLTVTLQSDQTVCGMAMLIFGTGLSGFIGKDVSGVAATKAPVTSNKTAEPAASAATGVDRTSKVSQGPQTATPAGSPAAAQQKVTTAPTATPQKTTSSYTDTEESVN